MLIYNFSIHPNIFLKLAKNTLNPKINHGNFIFSTKIASKIKKTVTKIKPRANNAICFKKFSTITIKFSLTNGILNLCVIC